MILNTNKFSHTDSTEVVKTYNNNPNYIIVDNNPNGEYVVVYFSSNGIYFPNTIEEYNKQIVQKNRYEWFSNDYRLSNAKKIVYVRDVYKQWYLVGINQTISNIDLLVELIRELSSGYLEYL
jgi:hypothetical protein